MTSLPHPQAQPPAVVARGLTRRFGPRRALDGVDLDVPAGAFLTLFGPNGAGKTTLVKTLATLTRPSSGSLSIFGADPRHEPDAVRRRIGLVGHAGFLYDGLTGRDNLAFFAGLHDLDDAEAKVEEMLGRVGLSDRADDPVRSYSRGMRQRLSIGRALINDPDLVLLDEPYTGLDQSASRKLRDILSGIRSRGGTVVMVTHHLEEGLWLSTRIGIMAAGRLCHMEEASGLSRDRLESVYRSVVDAIPS